jgi:digeranylgeranylglycerophospholipid reductase
VKAEVDVLVVGAGPGGLAAALWLSKAGADVAVVDARQRIGHPIRCAEIVTEKLFEEWDLAPRAGWIRSRIRRPDRGEQKREQLTINRARVEYEVSLIAAERGAEVAAGTSAVGVGPFDGERRQVALRSASGTHRIAARCVVAADGVSSAVARMAGIDTFLTPDEVASALAYRVEGAILADPEAAYKTPLPASMAPPPCYYWVTPNGPDSANVGLAVPGRDGTRARRFLSRMMEEDNACRGGRIVETVAGLLPGKRPLESPYRDGLLVVGGAARMVHPVSGAGILFAAKSGRAAAEQIASLRGKAATAGELAGYRNRVQWVYDRLNEGWRRLEEMSGQAGGAGP